MFSLVNRGSGKNRERNARTNRKSLGIRVKTRGLRWNVEERSGKGFYWEKEMSFKNTDKKIKRAKMREKQK